VITIRFVFGRSNIIEQDFYFPRKKSFRKNLHRINPTCIKQNSLRSNLKKILPNKTKHIEDTIYGIDYEYNGITIDQKFSFGDLGNNAIKIRARNRKLINKSNFTLCINEYGEIEFFKTLALAKFVNKNWGIVQKNRVDQKKDYVSYKVNLDDFYRISEVISYKTNMDKKEFSEVLNEITHNFYKEQKQNEFIKF
jgi:hypothetical protein